MERLLWLLLELQLWLLWLRLVLLLLLLRVPPWHRRRRTSRWCQNRRCDDLTLNLISQYFHWAYIPPRSRRESTGVATVYRSNECGSLTFKCPSMALLLPNVAPQHPGTGQTR